MKGLYKTQDGSKVEVLDFDEVNKMARTESGWVGEPEYSTWVQEGEEALDIGSEEIADVVQEEVVAPTLEVYEEPIVEETLTAKEEEVANEIEKDFEKEMLSDENKNPIIDEPKPKVRKRVPTKKKGK